MADRPPRSTQGNWPPAVFLSGGLAAQSLGVIGRYDLDPAAQCYVLAAGLGTAAAAAAPSVGPRFLRKHTDGLPHGAYCWELSEPEGPLAYCAEHERQPKAFAMAPRTAWNALGRFRGLRVPLLLACTLAPGAAADSGSGSGAHDDLPALVPILGGGGGGGDGACDGATARELGGKKLAKQLFFYPSRDSVLPAFVHGRPVAATTDRGAVSYEHRHFVDRDVLAATEEGRHLLTTLTRPCPPCSAVGGVKEEFVALTDRDDRPRTYVVGMLGDRLRVQIPFPTAGDGGTLTLDLAGVIVLASPPVPLHVSAKALEDPRTSGPAVAKRAVGRAHNLGRTQLGPLAFPERYRAHPYWEFFESVPSLGLCEFMNEAGDVLWAHLGQDLIQWDEGSTSSDASGADGASAGAAAAAWGGAGGVAEATVGLLSVEPRDDRSNAWCFACCHVLPNTEFSNRQLHNRASRRCTQCVVEGLPARGGVGGGSGGGAGSCRGGGGNSGGGRPRAGGGRDGAGGDGGGGGGGRGHVRKRSRKGARQRGPGKRGGRPQ